MDIFVTKVYLVLQVYVHIFVSLYTIQSFAPSHTDAWDTKTRAFGKVLSRS